MTRRPSTQPYAVIDPGAETDLIGGLGWHVLYLSDDSEQLTGALSGMGARVLPLHIYR